MARKSDLGLDWDEFLITGLQDAFVDYVKNTLGWLFDLEILATTHSWEEATGRPSSEISVEYAKFYQRVSSVGHSAKPVNGAMEALIRLQREYRLHIVTAVTRELHKDLVLLSQKLFPRVTFESINCGYRLNKGLSARELGLAYHVDDTYGELLHVATNSPNTVCVQFPGFYGGYSIRVTHPKIHRLRACDLVKPGLIIDERDSICRRAWGELEEFLLSKAGICYAIA